MRLLLFLILGFVLLVKGAELLIKGAGALAKRLNVSDLVIGLTVVAFGTSTAELFVNLLASIEGAPDIVFGNILGSNIFNIFFILGISALIFPLEVTKGTVWKEIPFTALAAALFLVLVNDAMIDQENVNVLSRVDGWVLLFFFLIFMFYTTAVALDYQELAQPPTALPHSMFTTFLFVCFGLAGLIFGSKLIVEGAINIAKILGVSESLVALTIVSAGTSLPELATSVVAATKKNTDIAVGNIVGSNIFNIFFILGISAVIRPQYYNEAFNADALIGLGASILMFAFMFTWRKKTFDRIEGGIFILLYVIYISFLIARG